MRFVVKYLIIAAVLAAPCVYDAYSYEPTLVTAILGTLRPGEL